MNNWYKFAIEHQKRRRDSNQFVTLWHISPEKFTRLSPVSRFKGQKGVFLSQSYRSLITDWAGYVIGKKHQDHDINVNWRDMVNSIEVLERNKNRTEEENTELKRLEDKRDKLNDKERERMDKDIELPSYKTLYVYMISCPNDVYERANNLFLAERDEEESPAASFGFWGWGEQVFIPDFLMKDLLIVGTKEINVGEYLEEYKNLMTKRQTPKVEYDENGNIVGN